MDVLEMGSTSEEKMGKIPNFNQLAEVPAASGKSLGNLATTLNILPCEAKNPTPETI